MFTRTAGRIASASLVAPALVTLLSGCFPPSSGAAPGNPTAVIGSGPPVTTESDCPNPRGGGCLGLLPAGEQRTTTFEPGFSYTVPVGWTNMEDLRGNFLLFRQQDSPSGDFRHFRSQDREAGAPARHFLGIYRNVHAAALDCDELWQGHVGTTPAELVAWYQTVPGLIVSEPRAVTVGGFDGLQIDLSLEPAAGACRFDGHAAVPLIIGNGISRLHHGIAEGRDVRLVFLEWGHGNITLEIASVEGQRSAEEFRSQLEPILDSLVFAQ